MTLEWFKMTGQYLHFNNEEQSVESTDNNYDTLNKARPALDINKFREYYCPSCDLELDKAILGFNRRFHLKQYIPGKPMKWSIKAWSHAGNSNGYLLKCQI
jgi:hypothetical protein